MPTSAAAAAAPTPAPESLPPVSNKSPRSRPPTLSRAAWKQFMGVARPYWAGDKKRTAWGLMALLIALIIWNTRRH